MTHFVLLHGAFHGAWCWARVAPLLRAQGHTVSTPNQTGLGERAHLLSPDITLDTFVDDVVLHLEAEELTDVVLVGHSFGGYAITGAAHRVPQRIRHLVYLDAVVPRPGISPLDASVPEVAAARRALAAQSGNISVAPPDPSSFGVPDGPDADWLRRRMGPHPFGALNTPIRFDGPVANGLPATYVFCANPVYESLEWARVRAREQGWAWREIDAGHDCMVTAAEATAALLTDIAA